MELNSSVFVPQQQPAPTTWEPDVEEFDDKGRTNPHYVKHWKFFAQTKDFLRRALRQVPYPPRPHSDLRLPNPQIPAPHFQQILCRTSTAIRSSTRSKTATSGTSGPYAWTSSIGRLAFGAGRICVNEIGAYSTAATRRRSFPWTSTA